MKSYHLWLRKIIVLGMAGFFLFLQFPGDLLNNPFDIDLNRAYAQNPQAGTTVSSPQGTDEQSQKLAEQHLHADAVMPLRVQIFYLSRCLYCSNIVRVLFTEVSEKFGNRVLVFALDMSEERIAKDLEKLKQDLKLSGDIQMLALVGREIVQGTDQILTNFLPTVEKELAKIDLLGQGAVSAATPPDIESASTMGETISISPQSLIIGLLGIVVVVLLFIVIRLSSRLTAIASNLSASPSEQQKSSSEKNPS